MTSSKSKGIKSHNWVFFLSTEMMERMIDIGRNDIKGRHYPRSYAMWASPTYNVNLTQIITIKKSHHHSEPCEDQHKYICQRPAAALEGSEALG